MSSRERISSVDNAWLRMDRSVNPMQIVGVMIFAGRRGGADRNPRPGAGQSACPGDDKDLGNRFGLVALADEAPQPQRPKPPKPPTLRRRAAHRPQ